ncbi:Endoribonuclease Dicer-like protein 4 [Hordeum vulgare]|nr:Endoribonuclease Dicer-like protein 4 [Hordeum vulgare]
MPRSRSGRSTLRSCSSAPCSTTSPVLGPRRDVCIFLAPTVPLVLQQATVIANSTNFRVQSYYGDGKNPRDHGDWETEMGESEVPSLGRI